MSILPAILRSVPASLRLGVFLVVFAPLSLTGIQEMGIAEEFLPVARLPVHPDLPDPLIAFDGSRVATPDDWTARRRPELLRLFQHYMYGFLPPAPANLRAKVELSDANYFQGRATKKQVTISFGPDAAPKIHLLLVIPNRRSGPAPVFVGMNFCGNHALLNDPQIPLPDQWIYSSCQGTQGERATEASRGTQIDTWAIEATIDRGYAVATFYSGDVDPDRNDFSDGVHPHFQSGPRTVDSWGTIAAWSWGIHRAVDYLVADSDLDRKRIAVVGHSRLGKTALLAAAFDERIALAIPHQAGCGGTAPSRGKVGESVKQINDRFPHWFDDVFKQFNDQPEKIPFDQHCLVALVAPRPVLFTNAVEDTWANPDGQFAVLVAADPVYRLLGTDGVKAKMPPPVGELQDGRLGYFVRAGKHSMIPEDWQVFLKFADKYFGQN